MNRQHKTLTEERWGEFSLAEQMANIGGEVHRAINWKNKGNQEYSRLAFYRALELIDLTAAVHRDSYPRLKEILRVREMLVDFLAGDNIYSSTDQQWEKSFYSFTYLARKNR